MLDLLKNVDQLLDVLLCSSSPLGELFDHGLDSTAVWMMSVSLLSCFGTNLHSHYEVFSLIVVIVTGFFLAHWEKYNTSVLYLPWAYDFSQLVCYDVV